MKRMFWGMLALLVVFMGCEDKDSATLELKTPEIMEFAGPGCGILSFTSSSAWQISSYEIQNGREVTPDWLMFDRQNGEAGEGKVVVCISKINDQPNSRTAYVEIKGSGHAELKVKIVQAKGPEGGRLIQDIRVFKASGEDAGKFEFGYKSDNIFHLLGYTLGDRREVCNWWGLKELTRSVIGKDQWAECYVNYKFEYISDSTRMPALMLEKSVVEARGNECLPEDFEAGFLYQETGKLAKIAETGSSSFTKYFSWEGDVVEMIQKERGIYYFSYSSDKEINNLNIDLFYLLLYGLTDWEDIPCLFSLTGWRPACLPEVIRYGPMVWTLTYDRDARGYITAIHITNVTENDNVVWKITYN